jgi:hypothetical protein
VVHPAERVTAQIASQHIHLALHTSTGPPLAHKAAVPLEYSIAWLICAFASQDAVMVG